LLHQVGTSRHFQAGSGAQPPSSLVSAGGFFPRVQQPEREAVTHLNLSKETWNYNFTSTWHLHDVYRGICTFSKVCVRLVVLEQKVETILLQQIAFDHYEPRSEYSDMFHCGLSLPLNFPLYSLVVSVCTTRWKTKTLCFIHVVYLWFVDS